jgi:kynurenine formamidase
MGPGVVLDIRHLNPDAAASVEDLRQALSLAEHELRAGDIVLIRTGNCSLWGGRGYHARGPGVSPDATLWLIDQGIRMMGIDAWGWDRPLAEQARQAKQTGREDVFWAAHYVGIQREFCHMERLANLDALPVTGFTVCAFPLKIKDGSSGPARVVALLEDS